MFGPPNLWYHQHMNTGPTDTRYITLHPARHIAPSYSGSGIPFTREDPWVRQRFEAELAKRGVKNQMPPELYTDPDFKWGPPAPIRSGYRTPRPAAAIRPRRPELAKPPERQ